MPSAIPICPRKLSTLKSRGIRFLGYVNPYLAVDGPQYAEAARLGYLALRLDSDEPYAVDFGEFDAGVVDFTNEDAFNWFADDILCKQMLDFGLTGWMADFGEYLPMDVRLHDGDPMDAHNRWPVIGRRPMRTLCKGETSWARRSFSCALAFGSGSRIAPCYGQATSRSIFRAMTALARSSRPRCRRGWWATPIRHSDVGGYTSLHGNVRTEELMQRWFELGAFTPVMRTHEGNRPDDNLQIDSTPELLVRFARRSRVHAALAPWVRHLCDEAAATGLPAQRPLFLHYPEDRETFTIQDQYLYGADLMVAPVIEEGAVMRDVYLPEGEWVHVWTRQKLSTQAGNTFDAPIGSPPVFWRKGSEYADLFSSLVSVREHIMTDRSNIRDVAKLAGVAVKTVSRVLNNHPYVSADQGEGRCRDGRTAFFAQHRRPHIGGYQIGADCTDLRQSLTLLHAPDHAGLLGPVP